MHTVEVSALPWQAIGALFALVSLACFLPLVWVRASLPTHSASYLLTLLAPGLLLASLVAYFPLFLSLQREHYHLNNELDGFIVVLVPTVTVLGAWILGIVDVLRRRAWGWLAPVVLVLFLGTCIYGIAGLRQKSGRPAALALDSLLLACGTLAILSVLMALIITAGHLGFPTDTTREMFAIFGGSMAVIAGLIAGLTLLFKRRTWAATLLVVSAVLVARLILGTTFPIQNVLATHWAPSIVLSVFGIPGTEPFGLWLTLALVAVLGVLEMTCVAQATERAKP